MPLRSYLSLNCSWKRIWLVFWRLTTGTGCLTCLTSPVRTLAATFAHWDNISLRRLSGSSGVYPLSESSEPSKALSKQSQNQKPNETKTWCAFRQLGHWRHGVMKKQVTRHLSQKSYHVYHHYYHYQNHEIRFPVKPLAPSPRACCRHGLVPRLLLCANCIPSNRDPIKQLSQNGHG